MKPLEENRIKQAYDLFRRRGGILRSRDAFKAGIHPRTLYEMRDSGVVERLDRGLYRLADLPPLGNPDFVPVAMKVPRGVICLISALAFHEITTQVPHEVYLALKRGAETPRICRPPIRIFWFTGESYNAGVETHKIDGVPVRIYSIEKTLADCFKYRNKIGLDIAIEALKFYRERRRMKTDELVRFAEICGVQKIMRPYLAMLI